MQGYSCSRTHGRHTIMENFTAVNAAVAVAGRPVGGRRKLLPVDVACRRVVFTHYTSSAGCTCIRQAVVVHASVCVMTDTMNFTNCRYHRLTAKQSLFTLPFTLGYLDIPYFVLFCCLNTAKSALSKRQLIHVQPKTAIANRRTKSFIQQHHINHRTNQPAQYKNGVVRSKKPRDSHWNSH